MFFNFFIHFTVSSPVVWVTSGACPKEVQEPWSTVGLWRSALGLVTLTKPTPLPFVPVALLLHFSIHFYKIRENTIKCFDSSH